MQYLKLYILVLFLGIGLQACKEGSVFPDEENLLASVATLQYTKLDLINETAKVYRINSDGQGKSELAPSGAIFSASASTRMVYDKGEAQFVIANLDGSNPQTITVAATGNRPILSPDGTKILYAARHASPPNFSNDQVLRIVNIDGSGDKVLVPAAAHEGVPVFSPDGSQVAFIIRDDYVEGISHNKLYTINVDGTNETLLSARVDSENDGYASLDWSPDGTKIVCKRELRLMNSSAVLVIDVATKDEETVAVDAWIGMPVFSPDSKQIVFWGAPALVEGGANGGLFIVNADGSSRRNLVQASNVPYAYPRWSPDGRLVAYTELNAAFSGSNDKNYGTLAVVDVVTGQVARLDETIYKAYWQQ